jgi:hypothetical protein
MREEGQGERPRVEKKRRLTELLRFKNFDFS